MLNLSYDFIMVDKNWEKGVSGYMATKPTFKLASTQDVSDLIKYLPVASKEARMNKSRRFLVKGAVIYAGNKIVKVIWC